MGYRVYTWSSHNILGKEGAAYGGPKAKRWFTLSVFPFKYKAEAEKELAKQKKYNEGNNKMFLFKYRIIKVK